MTSKEKALELHYICSKEVYEGTLVYSDKTAKKLSLIIVSETIKQLKPIEKAPNNKEAFRIWEEVKQEIENL